MGGWRKALQPTEQTPLGIEPSMYDNLNTWNSVGPVGPGIRSCDAIAARNQMGITLAYRTAQKISYVGFIK